MSRARNRRRETPIRRVNPSGLVVWVARYTNPEGRRVSAGTFKRKSDAQHAIDTAYEQPLRLDTIGSYFKQWPRLHPRAPRTQATNEHRVSRALDLKVEVVVSAIGRMTSCAVVTPTRFWIYYCVTRGGPPSVLRTSFARFLR